MAYNYGLLVAHLWATLWNRGLLFQATWRSRYDLDLAPLPATRTMPCFSAKRLVSCPQAGLQVSHHPRPAPRSFALVLVDVLVSEVHCLHGSPLVAQIVCLSIPIIKAAVIVVVPACNHHVHSLRLVADCNVLGAVIAIAHPALELRSVDGSQALRGLVDNEDAVGRGIHSLVEHLGGATRRRSVEVVP